MEEQNDKRSITTKAGDVAIIHYEWDMPGRAHPGLILGLEGKLLRVVSGTSQDWHEGDDSFVKTEAGYGGLHKSTYWQTHEVYLIEEWRVMKVIGEMPDGQYLEISEKSGVL